MTKYYLFTPHTVDQHTQSLADYMPNGDLFNAKNLEGSNFRRLLRGWAFELQRLEATFIEVTQEYNIYTTNDFIAEWERMVGIPDSCFSNEVDIVTRRRQVVVKLAAEGVNTREDFIDLASLLGFEIDITYPPEIPFYPPYDVPIDLITGIPESRYVWIVSGPGIVPNVPPYNVPFSLTSSHANVIQCFFEKLKPAHTKILYRNVPVITNYPPYDVPFNVIS